MPREGEGGGSLLVLLRGRLRRRRWRLQRLSNCGLSSGWLSSGESKGRCREGGSCWDRGRRGGANLTHVPAASHGRGDMRRLGGGGGD